MREKSADIGTEDARDVATILPQFYCAYGVFFYRSCDSKTALKT